MRLEFVLSLAVFATATFAQNNPLRDPQICGRLECKANAGGSVKFKYNPGTQYNYKYTVNVSTLFEGTSKNESTLFIQANVQLDFSTQCDGILSVSNVKLSENGNTDDLVDNEESEETGWSGEEPWLHRNSKDFAEAISQQSLRFAFQDGLITEVCPYEDEANWVLNFKKGILSMLHNSMKRFDLDHYAEEEEDIRGRCRTVYWVQGPNGTSLIINKKKGDLSMCTGHAKLHSMVQSTPYNSRLNNPAKSLLKSSSECRLSIDHRIYNDISCEERHIFQPFSNEAAGATTAIGQRLVLEEEVPMIMEEQGDVDRRSPLLYDYIPSPKPTSGELKTSRDLIKKLCKLSSDDVQTEFSDLFTKFIHTSRVLSYTALQVLYEHTICPTGKKHVLDALPFLGSSASITLMKDIILKRAVPESTVNEWMLAIALIPIPDASMLESAYDLLQAREDTSAVFSASSLAYTYCKQHEYCRWVDGSVEGIIQLLEDRAAEAYDSHKTDRVTQETLLVTLKALGNTGVVSDAFKETLTKMIEDPHLDVAIRVAAVETHRRLPCEESRPYFEELFRVQEENSEVRIAAYLQVMRCPNYLVIRTIKHSLETEEVNQVGSFIWSHLHNLLKSSIPSRVEIQGLLADKDLGKKFSSDVRKFSHNYEGSIFFEEYNVGGNYESNVIFSPASYVPRSAVLNLTIDLFGESINLLEVYGRAEGFEHYLESIFGPKGPYSSKEVQETIGKIRWGRSAGHNELLKSQIDKLPYATENDFGSPKVSLGMKLFGNELKYATFNGAEEIKDALRTLNLVDHLKRILSGKEINYNTAAMFLDSSYVVSSGAGLPVTLNAVGTSSINMQLRGSLKANNFIQNGQMFVNGTIKPSVAVDIVGTMSVDAYYASTAIKLKTSMYTSTAIEGEIGIQGSKLIRVRFSIPKKTSEIFGAKSELIVMKGSLEEPQAGINNARVSQSVCSWPAVDKTVGLKLCAEYHFMNVTEMNNVPYFILAGPAGFRLSLQKSDPTATTYFLEYKWNESPTNSHISITFDTPGSSVSRLVGGNLTIDKETQNLTLLLQSTEGTLLARGKYKNTDMEKYLELGLDINNQKNFDALLSLEKKPIQNGFIYEPKFYLGINGARVAHLQGTVKLVSKMGISQYSVNLKFDTKRLASKLSGYVSKRDTSISTSLALHYKFKDTKEHMVHMDFYIANRSTQNIYVINGEAKLNTTAYPNYNFNTTLDFQKSGARIESKLVLKAGKNLHRNLETDPEMLTTQLFFTYRPQVNSTQFKISATAQRPSTDLNVKGLVSYDVVGYTTNAMVLGRYSKDKEVLVTVYWHHPRKTLERVEGRLNVTIPGFSPMLLDGRLKEKTTGEYMVELDGTWFSGHSLGMRGLYQDRSEALASNHHLKLLLKSPSFEEINADCYYYRNNTEFKIDIKADQKEDNYALYIKHTQESKYEIMTVGRLKYQTQLYSISSTVSLEEKRQISLELHIDQIRDISLSMWAHNKEAHKEAGFEVKWDANRDPNQKLAVTVYYGNPKPYNYESNFHVSYPGRTVKGFFNFLFEDGQLSTITKVAWSPDDVFSVRFRTDYQFATGIAVAIEWELLTPFDEWRRTSVQVGFQHEENMYRANCSMYWQHDQHISIDLLGDYLATGSALKCEFTGTLNSTVRDIPSLSASVKHSHNTTKVDSELYMMYQPRQKIAITSSWQIDEDPRMKNLTGTVTLVSPFKGFNKGLLVSKIYVTSSRDLRGVANLDLDHKEFTASVEGHLQKLSKSMLEFNVTTPLEKFKLINGRFGFSEEQRHLVAKVEYPSGKTGVEVRFFVLSLTNFDIKFNLATPIEFLQEILIVAKLKPDTADFRAGWNTLLAGFSGKWHYATIKDFEYSYKIYTPIEGLEENGVVAKLVYKEGLDFEISVKLAEQRVGIVAYGQHKPALLEELGIKTQDIYKKRLKEADIFEDEEGDDDYDDDDEEDDEPQVPLRWAGYVQLYTIWGFSVKGDVDVEQKDTIYDVVATIVLPDGQIDIRDEFNFMGAFSMKNRLSLSTPYQAYKRITSNYDFKITMGHQYLFALDCNYLNGSRWIKTGTLAHYIKRVGRTDGDIYNMTLHVHTPLESFPLLDANGFLWMDKNAYSANFSIATNKSDISFAGELETKGESTKAQVLTRATTPILTLPESSLKFRKDFSDKENRIECDYKMVQNEDNKISLIAAWRFRSIKDMMGQLYLATPFKGLDKMEGAFDIHITKELSVGNMRMALFPIEVMANGTITQKDILMATKLDLNGKRHIINLDGLIESTGEKEKRVDAVLTIDGAKRDVVALVKMDDDLPVEANIDVKGVEGGPPINVHCILEKNGDSFVITSTTRSGGKYARIRANTVYKATFDWNTHLQIETSHQLYKTFNVTAKAESRESNRSIAIVAETPFVRLEKIRMGGFLNEFGVDRDAHAYYVLGDSGGSVKTSWRYVSLENMYVKTQTNYNRPSYNNNIAISGYYINPKKLFKSLDVGGHVDINKQWEMGGNLTYSKPGKSHIELEANVLLPKPNIELHTLTGKFQSSRDLSDVKYAAKYQTLNTNRNYGSNGYLRYHNGTNLKTDIGVEWGPKLVRNYVDLHTQMDVHYLFYKLLTPKFVQDTVVANVSYQPWNHFHNITGEFFYPSDKKIVNGYINFKEFANLNGFVNATVPLEKNIVVAGKFATETDAHVYNRYIQIYWPNNTAYLDSKCVTTDVDGSALERDTKGLILVEVPLTNVHRAQVDYEYSRKPLLSTGKATVEYNKEQIVVGKYNCESEVRAGLDKDTIHIELENKLVPIGADYVRKYEYGAPRDGFSAPSVDSKYLRAYHLHNRTAFDVTGDLNIETRETGQRITLIAIHSNRTVKLTTNYDVLDQEFRQNSRVDLGPNHWLAYDLDLLNRTMDETSEAQQIQINLSYPRRNFMATGSYNITSHSLSSEMSLDWNGDEDKAKTVQGAFDWRLDETLPNRQQLLLELKHPSLEKNVTILGEYWKTDRVLADVNLTVDYSPDPEQIVNLHGVLKNNSNDTMLNYTYYLSSSHPATKLQLEVNGGVNYRSRWFYSYHFVDYKRTYLPLQKGEATARIDVDKKEIEFKRKTLQELSYLWGRYAGKFPLYTANVSAIHGKDINASGEFYLNFREKLLQLELNMTTDGSQSAHMKGYVPDARSGYFDLWRDYETDRIYDITYYLRMNHSRLVVSSLHWRPELKQDIKDGIRAISVGMYNHTMENTEYWRQYIRAEIADAIADIWKDSKPLMQEFLDDVKDLRVIEEDMEELKVFLNDSYNNNEFYIKDVVTFVVYVVDEMSIRSHIESLPAIFSEIWEVMGESGKKIQKGITWVIDKIKGYYKNAAEFINGLFQGDPLEHLSDALKQLVEKYDNFIKDLHVSFIQYMENLWKQTYKLLLDNWHKTLAAIEPTFIKFIHYLETIAWNTSKEVLDFLYIRKSEIIENPYFYKISNFTHDLDSFYKDITGNDTIGSIYKYTNIAWNFLKAKYFELVPFGKELQEVLNEIMNEVNELKNLPSIRFIIERYNEVEAKVKWLCDYFDIENKLHRFITLVHMKLTDMKVTALEAENRYREAKTKFIFEPTDGIMHLEQKLPMSWHAFNETPNFQEIPEYKMLASIPNYFTTSKMTFTDFYHDYKPYMDPSDWLPPFKAQAMLVGSQYYITFDGEVYDFQGGCTYLLASDFLDGNFSVAVSYKDSGVGGRGSHELLVLVHDTVISIDVFANSVRMGDGRPARLPLQIGGDAYVYQETEIVTVESEMGFQLQCNMKFDVCMFEVSGWYFGKTAGLWGTMNNEPSDDLLTPNRTRLTTNDIQTFAASWALEEKCSSAGNSATVSKNTPASVRQLCESFFSSNVSPFSTCFPRVSNMPFYNMCLNSISEEEACTSAVAYMELCSYANTPLRIPDACVKCNLVNGTVVPEGTFVSMGKDTIPQSADIVFIVEAKECNKDLRNRKKVDEIVQQLDKELLSVGIRENRYSVVAFGGPGIYNKSRSIVMNNAVFTDGPSILSHFDGIPTGNGDLDIYEAIRFATKLLFRPGVSKTFILIPCSECKEWNMKHDFNTIHQLLFENDISLHILMNDEFRMKKPGMSKIKIYGIDRKAAYTRKDDEVTGDAALRKLVKPPKSTLGYCMPLALETNGSVFSGKRMELEKIKSSKKIAAMFAKRIARSAAANTCKTCECTGDNSGISYMECLPCHYPTPMISDTGFDEDEMLSVMQPTDDDFFDYE